MSLFNLIKPWEAFVTDYMLMLKSSLVTYMWMKSLKSVRRIQTISNPQHLQYSGVPFCKEVSKDQNYSLYRGLHCKQDKESLLDPTNTLMKIDDSVPCV